MNYRIKKFHQQGSIILFSIFIIAMMVTSTLVLARIFAPKIRSIYEAVNSSVALYGADTGSEVCLYEARKQPAAPIARPILTNGAIFNIASLSATNVDLTNDCRPLGKNYFKIRSTGTFRGISRSLEVSQ
ncbi:MAG TPA: hypothetical protein VEK36_01765 [Candidatus Paceibacterota bacterium]|nr:hypothetical protein [Candidatus Paceibacterota bacterium]